MISVIWPYLEKNRLNFNSLTLCLFFKQTGEVSQISRKNRHPQNFPTDLSPDSVDSFLLALAVQRLQQARRIATVNP